MENISKQMQKSDRRLSMALSRKDFISFVKGFAAKRGSAGIFSIDVKRQLR